VSSLARLLSRALPLLLVVAFMSPPVPAAAWAAPPSLDGESFTGTATFDTSGCDSIMGVPTGTGTFGFSTAGTAVNAYPGPFDESGSVTIGMGGAVTGFDASFTVTATSGAQSGDTVSGTKTLTPSALAAGACLEGIGLNIASTYSAMITLPSGEKFCDTGTAVTNFGIPSAAGNFTETFSSNLTTATPVGLSGTCP
jgi:hypothetical protein